jgi:L,D-peptidoglycan transpeptidase YkuD (ErfK/YbiS/YcfS/YnhG family)
VRLLVEGQRLICGDLHFRCAIGRGGFTANKKEGDGCTPLGTFALRECWYRADRLGKPVTELPLRVIEEQDGWCDDPASGEYNRHIRTSPSPLEGEGRGGGVSSSNYINKTPPLPNPPPQGGREYSYERLWHENHVYDIIIPLGYNDNPVIPGKGSAIFLHVARANYEPTEGCIALALPDLLALLAACDNGTVMEIRET